MQIDRHWKFLVKKDGGPHAWLDHARFGAIGRPLRDVAGTSQRTLSAFQLARLDQKIQIVDRSLGDVRVGQRRKRRPLYDQAPDVRVHQRAPDAASLGRAKQIEMCGSLKAALALLERCRIDKGWRASQPGDRYRSQAVKIGSSPEIWPVERIVTGLDGGQRLLTRPGLRTCDQQLGARHTDAGHRLARSTPR